MKNTLLLVFALSFLQFQAFSQQGFHMGLQVSPGLSTIGTQPDYGNSEMDFAPKFAYTAGIQLGYQFTDKSGLVTGAEFAELGGKWNGKDGGVEYDREINLSYIQIPLMYRYSSVGDNHFYVTGGFQLNLLQEAEQSYSPEYQNLLSPGYSLARQEDVTDLFESSSIQFVFQVGEEFMLSETSYLSVGLQGQLGITDMNAPEVEENLARTNSSYQGSRDYYGGIVVGFRYVIPKG